MYAPDTTEQQPDQIKKQNVLITKSEAVNQKMKEQNKTNKQINVRRDKNIRAFIVAFSHVIIGQ